MNATVWTTPPVAATACSSSSSRLRLELASARAELWEAMTGARESSIVWRLLSFCGSQQRARVSRKLGVS